MKMALNYSVWELKQQTQNEDLQSEPVTLPRGKTTIGRGLNNFMRLTSTLASRNHCEINLLDNGSIFIRDLNSLNGTFLGTAKILPERDISLGNGDIIGIGVDTTDFENNPMCIFHLIQRFLNVNELESRRYDKNVVPVNTLSGEGFNIVGCNFTGSGSKNEINAHIVRLSSESDISLKRCELQPQNDKETKPSAYKKNTNNYCDANNAAASHHEGHVDILLKTESAMSLIENNDNIAASNSDQTKDPTVASIIEANDKKHSSPRAEIDCGVNDLCKPQSTLNGVQQTSEKSSVSNTIENNNDCGNERGETLLIGDTTGIEVCNVKDVKMEFVKGKNTSTPTNLKNLSSLPKQTLIRTLDPEDEATSVVITDTNCSAQQNLFREGSSTNKIATNKSISNVSTLPSNSLKNLHVKGEIVHNDSSLECHITENSEPKITEHINSYASADKKQEHHTSSFHNTSNNKKELHMDKIVRDIFNKRLSNSSDINDIVNDSDAPMSNFQSKNETLSVMEKLPVDYSPSIIYSGKQFNKNQERKSETLYNPGTSNLRKVEKVEPLNSESFTIDDDIITIDDDDESLLPCSQMFDENQEEIESDFNDSDIPIVDIVDDDDILSEADSSDEWFLRLSQCEPSDIKTLDLDDSDDDSNFKSEVKLNENKHTKSNIFVTNLECDDGISKEDSNQPHTHLEMTVESSDEDRPGNKNREYININKDQFSNVNLELEPFHLDIKSSLLSKELDSVTKPDTALESNLNDICLKTPNSKCKRKHSIDESVYENVVRHDQEDGEPNSKIIKKTKTQSPMIESDGEFAGSSLKTLQNSKSEKLASRDLNEDKSNKSKSKLIKSGGDNKKYVKSVGESFKNLHNKKNEEKEQFTNFFTIAGEQHSNIINLDQDGIKLKSKKDTGKPAWAYLIDEIVAFSDQWDANEGYTERCHVINNKNIPTNSSSQTQDKHTTQGQEDGVGSKLFSDANVLNTKLRETVKLSYKPSKETNIINKTTDSLKSSKSKYHSDLSSELKTAQEMKLDAIQKKISDKYDKRPTPLVGAKSLPAKKKRLGSPDAEYEKGGDPSLNEMKTHESNLRLSKCKKLTKKVPSLSSEKKMERKLKLAEIAHKTNLQQNTIKKTKDDKSIKRAIKITHKNRTEMFIDHLVPNNNLPKEEQTADGDPKVPQVKSLSEYKIPRKNVNNDENLEIINEVSCSKQTGKKIIIDVNSTDLIKPSKTIETNKIVPPRTIIDLHRPQEPNCKGSDKMVNTSSHVYTTKQKTSKINEVQSNERSHSELQDKQNTEGQINKSAIGELKSIMKPCIKESSLNNSSTKKKVSFHRGDENLIVNTHYIEIEEGSSLKPVTKHVVKKDTPPQRLVGPQMPYCNYFEETLYMICKWNTVWFQEKNKCKGEPPVFKGQLYHMQDSFAGYSEYRRSIFPLMLHELWAGLAREHDIVQNKNKPFLIDVLQFSIRRIAHTFYPTLKDGEKITLCSLGSQILLERSNQSAWPRMSDLVVLDTRIIDSKGKSFKQRILGYIFVCNTRAISSHTLVSQKLKAKNVKATMVMDLTIYIKLDHDKYKIDNTQETRIAVLKNMRPELRLFNALDCLSTSSMLNIICQPSINNLDLPIMIDMERSTCPVLSHLNESQKKAVKSVASACLSNTDMIHFVHGPPGCGKSEVIISIIQMIFLAHVEKKLTEPPKILLCAPSNAAIDDIFMKLMLCRNKFKKIYKNKTIKMVRIGRTDFTHKNVRSMTLDCLVEKDLKKSRDIIEDEQSRMIELTTLEAKKNQLNYQLENPGTKKNDNRYIRNVEIKLAETIKTIKELEKGKNQKPLEGKELREKKKERELMFLEGANVIASTLSSCYNPQMEIAHLSKRLKVTCCIVDEATQCTEPEVLIPLMMGVRQLVLVGDPLQLPATVLSSTAKEHGFGRSLFARHRDWWLKKPEGLPISRYHFLDTQYRMHPDIAKWPSEHFYNSSFKNHSSLIPRSLNHPLLPYIILSHSFTQSNHEESNYEEVALVEHLVGVIKSSGLGTDRSIGIITPYNRQKELLKAKLHGIEVGTVDSFQGQERDIIILSCVRTEGVGFLSGTERLNVALTRAKYTLIICGNFKSLQADSSWGSLLQDAKARGVHKTVAKSYRPAELLHVISKAK